MYAILYLPVGEIVKPLPTFDHEFLFKTFEAAQKAINDNRVCIITNDSDKEYKKANITSFLNSRPILSFADDIIPRHLLEIIEIEDV